MLIQLTDPLFSDPSVRFSLGPGFLVENLAIIDPFTATADVTVGPRATRTGHVARVTTDDTTVSTCIDVDRETDPQVNTQPGVTFECPAGLLAGEPVEALLNVDDADGDIVIVEVALKDIIADEIVFSTHTQAYETPQVLPVLFPGVADGPYMLLVIVDDGLVDHGGSVCTCNFQVGKGPVIPAVSEWGLVVMSLLGLTAGTLVLARRSPATTESS